MKTKKPIASHRARGGVANADLADNTAAKSPRHDPFSRQLVVPEENQMAEQTAEGREESVSLEKPLTPVGRVGHMNQHLSVSAKSKTEMENR